MNEKSDRNETDVESYSIYRFPPFPPEPEPRLSPPLVALLIGGALLLLFLLPLIFGRSGGKAAEGSSTRTSSVPEDLIVNERDLKNRVEVSADDFRSKRTAIIEDAFDWKGCVQAWDAVPVCMDRLGECLREWQEGREAP